MNQIEKVSLKNFRSVIEILAIRDYHRDVTLVHAYTDQEHYLRVKCKEQRMSGI